MTGPAPAHGPRQTNWRLLLTCLLVGLAAMRIVATYTVFSETFDEPAHIAAGLELLDRGTYTYETQHPPLARIAAALGPYLSGSRSQGQPDMWNEGRAILYSGNTTRTLFLARLGMLPFFLLACAGLWTWTRRVAGESEALVAVALFTLSPPVLAHAGLATTDMAFTAAWIAFFWILTQWLDEPSTRNSVWLGAICAFVLTSKLSGIPFLGVAVPAIIGVRWRLQRAGGEGRVRLLPGLRPLGVAAGMALLGIWAVFGFQSRILDGMPLPLRLLWDGLQAAMRHNTRGQATYLLGRAYFEGDWRFFPVALGVKAPLTLLALGLGGAWLLARRARAAGDWRLWVPLIAALAVLVVTIPARINLGVRHVLPVFVVLAMTGGIAVAEVWRKTRVAPAVRAAFIVLVVAGLWSTARVHPDYLAYFNELAGAHPERVLVDSDLDWGQDLPRLADTLRARRVDRVTTAYFGSAEPAAHGVPVVAGWKRGDPVNGWFAVSQTLRQRGTAQVVNGRWELHPDALQWLDAYEPVARIGKSMLLYHVR
jgi:hypothetical protein